MNPIAGLAILGLTSGILGGLFGIGGGAIMVPVMVLLLGFEQRFAVGTSLAAMLLPWALPCTRAKAPWVGSRLRSWRVDS